MTRSFSGAWGNVYLRSIASFATIVAGIALPIDFLAQVDGYLKYLRPWELLQVFGWALVTYVLLGTLVGLCTAGLAAGAGALLRRDPVVFVEKSCLWLSLSLVVLELIHGAKLWLVMHESGLSLWWLSSYMQTIKVVTIVVCAGWVFCRRVALEGILQLARTGLVAGLIVALLSPLVRLLGSPEGGASVRPSAGTFKPGLSHPNIIIVTADALTAGHLSIYGYPLETSPNLKKLAQHAHVFRRFYANSNFTTPTVNSIINGVRPWTHRSNQLHALTPATIANHSIVARLKQAGYQTFAVSTNPFAAPANNGTERWFDAIARGKINESLSVGHSYLGPLLPHFSAITNLSVVVGICGLIDHALIFAGIWSLTEQNNPELAMASARAMLDRRDPKRPFFLWIHLMTPHSPYATPRPFSRSIDPRPGHTSRFDSTPPQLFLAAQDPDFPLRYTGRYDEAITYMDHHIGQFCDWLEQRSLLQGSILAVTADHGESFSHNFGGHGGPMLHEDLIRIPLLIKEPYQLIGQQLGVLAEQIDLLPTLLDLANITLEGPVEGRSLRPALSGAEISGPVFSMNFEQNSRFLNLRTGIVTMIEGDWKYVEYLGHPHYPMMPPTDNALFDLRRDPGETRNCATDYPAIATRMKSTIEDQLTKHGGPNP